MSAIPELITLAWKLLGKKGMLHVLDLLTIKDGKPAQVESATQYILGAIDGTRARNLIKK